LHTIQCASIKSYRRGRWNFEKWCRYPNYATHRPKIPYAAVIIGIRTILECSSNWANSIGTAFDILNPINHFDELGYFNGITSLPGYFRNSGTIYYWTIPINVKSFHNNAVYHCRTTRMICLPLTPPTWSKGGVVELVAIYVPDESLEAYKVANIWKGYADKIHPLSEYTGD